MKHSIVLAVLAVKCDVLAEIHILEVIGDKTAVTSLYPLAECFEYVCVLRHLFHHATFRAFDKVDQQRHLFTAGDLGADAFEGLRHGFNFEESRSQNA